MNWSLWDIVFLTPLILAVYVFIKGPLKKKWNVAEYVDPILGFALALISIVYIYFAHFALNLIPESDFAPCGRLSKQIECYNLSQDTCMTAWRSSVGDCEEQLIEIRKQRPTALMGAFLEVCIGRNFDKIMRYNRKNLESPVCQAYFKRMEKEP